MPNLDPITKYQPNDPYNHYYDNLPIESIEDQLYVVNAQVDINQNELESSLGSTGSLAARLNKSLESDGSLKASAMDDALHSIGEHTDDGGYVRMTDDERSKLSLIDDEATNLSIQIETVSNILTWPGVDSVFKLVDSEAVTWDVSGGEVAAHLSFSTELVSTPRFDITPYTTDNINFSTSTLNTPYQEGTLRVYVNGLRLTKSPKKIGGFWYEEVSPAGGTFELNKALVNGDIIRIDFNQPLS